MAGSLAASRRRAVSACRASGHRDCPRREGRRVSLSREGLVKVGSPYRTALRRSSLSPYGAHGHDRHLGAHTTARGVVNATSPAPARGAGVAGGSPPGSSSSAFLRSVQRLDGWLYTCPDTSLDTGCTPAALAADARKKGRNRCAGQETTLSRGVSAVRRAMPA